MRPKRIQAGYGLKYVVERAARKFKASNPAIFNGAEIETLVAIALYRDFFVSSVRRAVNHLEHGTEDFGRIYFRQPRETVEFLLLIQMEIEKIKRKDAGIIRLHLATHANHRTDQQLADYLNARHRLSITRQSVETERQKFCDEIERLKRWESPEVVHLLKTYKPLRRAKSKQKKSA